MYTRPLRELSPKEIKEIKEDLEWIVSNFNPEKYSLRQDKFKKTFPRFNLIRYRIKGNVSRYFRNKEINELKVSLDNFLKTLETYEKTKKLSFLLCFSLNKKAKILFSKTTLLLEYINENLKI